MLDELNAQPSIKLLCVRVCKMSSTLAVELTHFET